RWSPTGRLFNQEGKIVDSSDSESKSDCSNGDNACTFNILVPKIKRFPNFTSLLDRLSRFVMVRRFGLFQAYDKKSKASRQFRLEVYGNCLPKFKYHKEHLCPSREQGKRKRAAHPPKPVSNSRSKDEAPEMIITFLKRITVLLQSPVIIKRTDNDTKFKNQVLKEYFDTVGISHKMSSVRTPQQNRVVEGRNRTLVEAARTMLIFSRAPLFLWAEAIATACFTQNRSIIHRRFSKTPYELINSRKSDISFLHVSDALCYPKNDREDIGKLGAKDTAPIPTNSSSLATNIPITSHDVDEPNSNAMIDGNTFVNPFANSSTSAAASSSSQNVDPSNMHTFYQPYPYKFQWTKD
nr:putative ribonuclease H-like domain-containing protein [Tanacetum cinerariifolium]